MKTFIVKIKVHEDKLITENIKAKTWKAALVMHSVLKKTAILELSELWLKDYNETVNHYKQFDILISVDKV